jgi:hypothetical protein
VFATGDERDTEILAHRNETFPASAQRSAGVEARHELLRLATAFEELGEPI